jgi:3'-phosphoadenosine 5'-phosphosulfate sulfotransferase (PAPS reductase)/FAD synthetase
MVFLLSACGGVMSNPYFITGPALISFSGGRTSAYMLYQILQAHGGNLPDDVIVAFANTGKEREETLRFVHECATRWGVLVHWLEWRDTEAGFEEVGFNSASRNGEPFAGLIAKKKFLPNAVTRYCTTKLKVEIMKKFMMSLGYERWLNAIGLRYDEGMRVLKQIARNEQGKERWKTVMPMASAATKVTKREILAFWAVQPFDLRLAAYEGNCDMCFLKSRGALKRLCRDNPGMADWWKQQEATVFSKTPAGARFVTEYSYADLEREVRTQPYMPGLLADDEEFDAECGLMCAGETA